MPATPKTADPSGHLLRSISQIARVLAPLAARRNLVTAELPDGPFTARIIRADQGGKFIIVTATADQSANAALLDRARVTFVSETGNWHIEFVAAEPCKLMHDGAPAIRLRYPEILAVLQRRRNVRHDAHPAVPLRCVADAGGITPFDAQIRDISTGGLSVLLYPSDIMLEPGTVLVGSRIKMPGTDPVSIDMEVRYSETVTLPDGSHVHCSGFRFIGGQDFIKRLIDTVEEY